MVVSLNSMLESDKEEEEGRVIPSSRRRQALRIVLRVFETPVGKGNLTTAFRREKYTVGSYPPAGGSKPFDPFEPFASSSGSLRHQSM